MIGTNDVVVNPDRPVRMVAEFVKWIGEAKKRFVPSKDSNEIPCAAVYRGQKKAGFELVSSLHRNCRDSLGKIDGRWCKRMEEAIINEVGRHYPDEFKKLSSYIEQLTWLQHFGFPTRLLDVTGNALVALYFAAESVGDKDAKEKNGKVYVIGVTRWERECTAIFADKNLQECSPDLFANPPAAGAIRNNRKSYGPRLIMPPFLSERQRRQCGMFYLMSNCIDEIDERVARGRGKLMSGEDSGTLVQEILIDGSAKGRIRQELEEDFGITRHFLFPESPTDMVKETMANVEKRLSNPPLTIPYCLKDG